MGTCLTLHPLQARPASPQLPLPVPQGCHMNLAESADLPVPETDSGVLGEVLWNDPGDICQFIPPVAVLRA